MFVKTKYFFVLEETRVCAVLAFAVILFRLETCSWSRGEQVSGCCSKTCLTNFRQAKKGLWWEGIEQRDKTTYLVWSGIFFSLSRYCDLHLCFYAAPWHPDCRELLFSAGNREIFWLRAYKSPVIADHPGARYSPDTENGFHGNARSPATGRFNVIHRRRRQGAAERDNPFDNMIGKHATALWLCLTQSEEIPLSLQLTILTCYEACGFTAPQG